MAVQTGTVLVRRVDCSVIVEHCKNVTEAIDLVKSAVVDEISRAAGFIVPRGKVELIDWDCDGNVGDKTYNLHFSFKKE